MVPPLKILEVCIFLEFNNPDKKRGPLIDTMKKVGAGNCSSAGNYLSQESKWEKK
jgi:hypothetical protein